MIYEVIVKQKTNLENFDYFFDGGLEKGQLVKVQFNKKIVTGLIFDKKEHSPFKVKSIKKVLTEKPFITDHQFDLAKKISDEYFSNYADAIFSFIPNFTNKSLMEFNYARRRSSTSNKSFAPKIIFCKYNDCLEDVNNRKSNGQMLIIVPKVEDCIAVKNYLKDHKTIIYNSQISEKERLKVFSELLSGENLTVISTRIGSLLPFTNLKHILMFDPNNFAYQEDQMPRYNGEKTAYLAAKIYNADLTFVTTYFDIFTFVGYKKKLFKKIGFIKQPSFEISNSKDPSEEIKSIGNGKILLVYKESDSLFCGNCHSLRICKNCGSSQFTDATTCKICKSKQDVACDKCAHRSFEKSQNLKNIKAKVKNMEIDIKEENDLNLFSKKSYDTILYLNNDHLLKTSLLNAKLRLMQKIRNLFNYNPKKIIIFTREIDSSFWKNLLLDNQERFISAELSERRQNKLPPFTRLVKITDSQKNKSDLLKSQELAIEFDSIEAENNFYLFLPLNTSEKKKISEILNSFKSAKFYLDPIDLN